MLHVKHCPEIRLRPDRRIGSFGDRLEGGRSRGGKARRQGCVIVNDVMQEALASLPPGGPDLGNLLDVPMVESVDVSNAIAWLVSDEARYVTGVALPVDAGFLAK
jgi:NAD(P)-dependent dehydrogenase (short-subunit alcohol dehydrogenase family)